MRFALGIFFATTAGLLALENPGRKPPPSPFALKNPPAFREAGEPKSAFEPGEDSRPFANNPTGGGLSLEGAEETVQPFTTVTVTFPAAMVASDRIDEPGVESPVVVWPPLDTEFVWSTPTQGYLTFKGPVIPAQTYRLRLREGLQDAGGVALPADVWGAEMSSAGFQVVSENYGERDTLNARPQVPLEFNYPVRLDDAAVGIWFQDRASRERFPVEVLLNVPEGDVDPDRTVDAVVPDGEKFYGLRVRPVSPLPVGRFFDLVVEGVKDAYAGRGLAYPRVFPMGPTRSLKIAYVAARNRALEKPTLEVKFNRPISETPLSADVLKITPPVANLRVRPNGAFLMAEGDFQIGQRYTVRVSDQIPGAGGYGLAAPETWGATFRPKTPEVIFPDRTLRERSALGLRFAFYQVNTGLLEWKLAAIPAEVLPDVTTRLREFDILEEDKEGDWVWTEEGTIQRKATELLIPAFGLPVVASGTVPDAPGESETLREITWSSPAPDTLRGPMLLEITGSDSKGRVVGNRAMVYFGEAVLTRKVTPTGTIVRVARMRDGQPVAGAAVLVLDAKLREITSTTTDADGLAVFAQAAIPDAVYFQAVVDGAPTLQPVWLSDAFPSGSVTSRGPPPLRTFVFTDRPLYRPGQEVVFKGLVREEKNGELRVASGQTVKWSIEPAYGGEVFASGETKVDAEGGWHGAWTPPADGPLGALVVRVTVGGVPLGPQARFRIEEFRNPLYSVICEPEPSARPAEAVLAVQSQYFHGAPNAGAAVRWTATWIGDSDEGYYDSEDGMKRVDLHSEKAARPSFLAEISGETALDANGRAVLRCDAPFPDLANRAHATVIWKVDVTGPDGQTLTGGAEDKVAMGPVLLGVKTEDAGPDELRFTWDAVAPFGEKPKAVRAELFLVLTKSVRERIAPEVYRYRNFDEFVSVQKVNHTMEKSLTFRPAEPGRYVLVVTPLPGAEGFPVSETAYLSGDEPSEVPVVSDTSAEVFSVQGRRDPQNTPWQVGETAVLTVLSPTGGVAWVSVETDRILDTFTVPIQGNTTRIEIPVKPEYEPNAFVSVYILRPGGEDALAGEMFGSTILNVMAPGRRLDVKVRTDRATYEPRETLSGTVQVTAGGQPVAGADVAIYAVDDSILELGGWRLPEFLSEFFPARNWAVTTFSALKAYVDKIAPSWLTAKGFVIGDGGEEAFGNVTFARREFKPRILWLPGVKTNTRGEAAFSCEAPDNLTRFRVIAVAQTRANQFGAGDGTLTVTKNLLIDPALPRFVREGDEVELRAVARQKIADTDTLRVRCTVGGVLELLSDPVAEVSADRDAPAVVRFRARARAEGSGTVKFEVVSAADPQRSDAVEVTVPVAQPVILKKESVAGTTGNTTFAVREVAPGEWENGRGTFSFAMSTTPWLAKLMGLPFLLEYPHGCLEQKTSRLLAITYLGNLLEYLPDSASRRANYHHVAAETLHEIEASLLPDGSVPYWPQGTEPNDYVTIQTAWCVAASEAAGFEVPDRLATELPEILEKIVTRQARPDAGATLRAFALFVLAPFGEEPSAELKAAAEELFLQRDQLSGEGRAMLALALHGMGLAPEKQTQLLDELPRSFDTISFRPDTFASATRTEALCTWARLAITPAVDHRALNDRLNKLLESSATLSTQENLWLLVAFDALLKTTPQVLIKTATVKPAPDHVSENKTAMAWTRQDLARLADFVVNGLPKPPGSFVLSAAYFSGGRTTMLESSGLRVERVVKNLSDPARTGSAAAPFRLGDSLLISYRFSTENPQSYVALEDLLPGGVEVVNPDLALFGKHYTLPEGTDPNPAALSYSELRDQQTNLYFDHLPAGTASYSVLARATAAGSFIWPATQIQPMYDSRFFGRSPSGSCVIVSE